MPTSTDTLLPIRPAPKPDELFSSWLIRLSAAYGLKTRVLCGMLVRREVEFTTDLDGSTGETLQRAAAARTGLDPDTLMASHTLTGFGERLFPALNSAKGTCWVLPLGTFAQPRPSIQYCPDCLREAPAYFRRVWRLSLFGVCPAHGAGLRHVCPSCCAAIHPIKNVVRHGSEHPTLCWRCEADLRRSPTCPAAEEDARLGRKFWRALQDGVLTEDAPAGVTAPAYFAGLALVCARLMNRPTRLDRWRRLAAESAGVGTLPPPVARHISTSFDTLPDPASRRAVLRTADWLLGEWPERFLKVAREAGTRTSDFARSFVTTPAWFLEPLQTSLTPPRRKPVPSPGLLQVRRMRQLVLEHRREWSPSKLPRLIRALRAAGFYSPNTDDCVIMRSLPNLIARLRTEGADYRLRLTRQIPRDTPEWSRLILLSRPYRKNCCAKQATLRRGIRRLCADRFLSSRDLSELLHRSRVALTNEYLLPMVKAGELKTRFDTNRGGARSFPGQAYRTADGSSPIPTNDLTQTDHVLPPSHVL